MTILDQWNAHRKTCHLETESERIGDAMAEEIERMRGHLDFIASDMVMSMAVNEGHLIDMMKMRAREALKGSGH